MFVLFLSAEDFLARRLSVLLLGGGVLSLRYEGVVIMLKFIIGYCVLSVALLGLYGTINWIRSCKHHQWVECPFCHHRFEAFQREEMCPNCHRMLAIHAKGTK